MTLRKEFNLPVRSRDGKRDPEMESVSWPVLIISDGIGHFVSGSNQIVRLIK